MTAQNSAAMRIAAACDEKSPHLRDFPALEAAGKPPPCDSGFPRQ